MNQQINSIPRILAGATLLIATVVGTAGLAQQNPTPLQQLIALGAISWNAWWSGRFLWLSRKL